MIRWSIVVALLGAVGLSLQGCSSDDNAASTTSGSSGATSGAPRTCEIDGGGASQCPGNTTCAVSAEPGRVPICYSIVPCGSTSCASGRCGDACETSPCPKAPECLK